MTDPSQGYVKLKDVDVDIVGMLVVYWKSCGKDRVGVLQSNTSAGSIYDILPGLDNREVFCVVCEDAGSLQKRSCRRMSRSLSNLVP